MKLGLTLPSFVEDPEVPLAVARAAEASGVDGVFAYDHLFRMARDGASRPAIEATVLLGALAVETASITLGSLVVRATLRPPATLAVGLDTVRRIAGARLIVGVGAGDEQSRAEMQTFGLPFGTETDRITALRRCVRSVRDRGYPVWVAGRARHVGLVAAEGGDGWNRWGGSVDQFTRERAEVEGLAARLSRSPSLFCSTWAGLVVLGRTEADAEAKRARLDPAPDAIVGGPEQVAERLREYGAAGARWLVLGPVDSSDPENAAILGELVRPLLD